MSWDWTLWGAGGALGGAEQRHDEPPRFDFRDQRWGAVVGGRSQRNHPALLGAGGALGGAEQRHDEPPLLNLREQRWGATVDGRSQRNHPEWKEQRSRALYRRGSTGIQTTRLRVTGSRDRQSE